MDVKMLSIYLSLNPKSMKQGILQ